MFAYTVKTMTLLAFTSLGFLLFAHKIMFCHWSTSSKQLQLNYLQFPSIDTPLFQDPLLSQLIDKHLKHTQRRR